MRLELANLNKEGYEGVVVAHNRLTFHCTRPIIIQPSEILRVQIDAVLQLPPGYVLNISTHPDFYEKAGELFPASAVLDEHQQGEIFLRLQNNGRNPLYLKPGDALAQGYIVRAEEISCQELKWQKPAHKPLPQTGPQKRDPFRFEVK